MIVIYTSDVMHETTNPIFEIGTLRMEIEEGFLTELNSDLIRYSIINKIRSGETINDEDMMKQ